MLAVVCSTHQDPSDPVIVAFSWAHPPTFYPIIYHLSPLGDLSYRYDAYILTIYTVFCYSWICFHIYIYRALVVLTSLKNISQWEGLSHILWENKKYSKPPTRDIYIYTYICPTFWCPGTQET